MQSVCDGESDAGGKGEHEMKLDVVGEKVENTSPNSGRMERASTTLSFSAGGGVATLLVDWQRRERRLKSQFLRARCVGLRFVNQGPREGGVGIRNESTPKVSARSKHSFDHHARWNACLLDKTLRSVDCDLRPQKRVYFSCRDVQNECTSPIRKLFEIVN